MGTSVLRKNRLRILVIVLILGTLFFVWRVNFADQSLAGTWTIKIKNFDEEVLNDLTNSIKERGVIQPIIVRKSNSEKSEYEIIAGERRWLAAQKAGLHEIPITILDLNDSETLEVAIVENIQRVDLNIVDLDLVTVCQQKLLLYSITCRVPST